MNPLSSARLRMVDTVLSREFLNILEVGGLLTHGYLQNS